MSFAVYHKLSGEKGLYMWLSRYFVYFIIFSCMGWIYESIYCTIRAKNGKTEASSMGRFVLFTEPEVSRSLR